MKRKLINFFIVLLTIIIFSGACAGSYLYFTLKSLNKDSQNLNSKDNVKPIDVKGHEPVNILILGVDVGTPNSKDVNDPKRTDTMLLMNYNPDTSKVTLISIPRDTAVSINGRRQKINEAHAIGGVSESVKVVENLLHIDINYFGKIDYAGFRKIIDSIGGIDIQIPYRMDYDDPTQNLSIHFNKGETVHLNGKKAEEFFRWRKNNDGTGFADGDIGRINNQHMFISKVIDKFKSPSIISKIPAIASTVVKYAETNMSPEEILKYGLSISKEGKDNISLLTLKGNPEYINGISYYLYEEKQNKDIAAILNSSNTQTLAPVDKKTLSINILNYNGKTGIAKSFQDRISSKGYTNITIGNGSGKINESKIAIKSLDDETIEQIKADFGISNVEALDKDEKFDIIIKIGQDYKEDN